MRRLLFASGYFILLGCQSLYCQDNDKGAQITSVKIGEQVWSADNLEVLTFRNGDSVPHARSAAEWEKAGREGTPAWCYYRNDTGEVLTYGRMYNWFAVNDARGLAPVGWRIATQDDWIKLEEFLGMDEAGVLFRSDSVWNTGNVPSGTGILLGGYRTRDGRFTGMGEFTYMASATEADVRDSRDDQTAIWGRGVHIDNKTVMRCALDKHFGLYVRCVRDQIP
ncbi:fibrobacter succinogenes major paralogous domain-containing protein [Chitinophaga sp. XS-30]|uniref:fibrobacter succinogenes major paralogous domain-containing protein n=1 Tax=Chitinophaga sp. XS-30 TaxID=2604421 RepID=UPI0011DDF40A|nr:fibrobacter succinogenes major paralogous domain-containing protein [Chitinophaga sp. XS-30]QEH42462.1 hypothetical protein FW415_16925 [Chitinophaga sp. XS-30]